MSWEVIGALSNFLGAVAVVLSLVYLARQIKLSNRLSRAEAWRAAHAAMSNLNATWGRDPEFRRLFRKITAGATRSDLKEEERALVGFYLVSLTDMYGMLLNEVKEGILPPRVLDSFGGNVIFQSPYFRSSWRFLSSFVETPLQEHLEAKFGLANEVAAPGIEQVNQTR